MPDKQHLHTLWLRKKKMKKHRPLRVRTMHRSIHAEENCYPEPLETVELILDPQHLPTLKSSY